MITSIVIVRRVVVCLALLSLSSVAFAGADIVYSARIYAGPGADGHFHLYRINPDGSGKAQITTGPHDDQHPKWSPDGRYILFVRDRHDVTVSTAIGADLHKLTTAWSPDADGATWWPDSRHVVVPNMADSKPERFDVGGGPPVDMGDPIASISFSTTGEYALIFRYHADIVETDQVDGLKL